MASAGCGLLKAVKRQVDPQSIMLYRFPANYYNPGSSDCQPVGNGMTLSAQDIVGLDILYPADEERIETILEFEQAETVRLVKTR